MDSVKTSDTEDDNALRLSAPSSIVDRKIGSKKAESLRPADKMAIIDSVRDGELLGWKHCNTNPDPSFQ